MTVFHIITLFPDSFSSYLNESILKRAIEDKKIGVKFYNPRDFTVQPKNRKQTYAERRVDDKPYGGGPGMVIEALPVIKAIESALKSTKLKTKDYKLSTRILWLTPSGEQFTTATAKTIATKAEHIVIICGRYEGIDARVKKVFPVTEISVGPFVLTGGELPAMLIMDSVSRQVKGVLGNFSSLEESRVSSADVYTRPEFFLHKKKKYAVPPVLLSGHAAKIEEWRKQGRKITNA
ncbi:MAG: tRNA ((1)-)-methyltransferase, tRNA (guanine37-N1)-methyltransferase [Candidatus Parcubacteria bacterium]|jgi:tRNA (guanine37-N1)-methyltransferase